MTGDSAVKRGTYSTKLRSRQDNGCPSLAHSHTVSTQLYQTLHSFLLPLLSSALSLSFSHVRLSSPHHRGMGDNETPAHSSPHLLFSLSAGYLLTSVQGLEGTRRFVARLSRPCPEFHGCSCSFHATAPPCQHTGHFRESPELSGNLCSYRTLQET